MASVTSSITPSRNSTSVATPVTVDISTIEAAKENIQPLVSGRSASQLVSLSSHSRSGLGSKLQSEHKKFESQIKQVDAYESTGQYSPSEDPSSLSLEEVQTSSEDPLDLHHQYIRFVIANYPAGANATNKLVPLLENSTRRFLKDERYKNDPRYLRLWNLYAKHIECPEDCYKFLFAKGIGERLAMLYEEYAAVLEQVGRRTQADQIYSLGINRSAAPLDRLKKRYSEFTARMLVAPPIEPSPPSRASTDPSINPHARPALSGSGITGTMKENKPFIAGNNGASAFAIFKDGSADSSSQIEGAEWNDLGTVKSRKRENEIEAGVWKGETMHMEVDKEKPAGLKLQVFRDADAPATMTSHLQDSDVFGRSMRGPSEAELLRKNPFKNYDSNDSKLATVDPLEGLTVIAPPKSTLNKPTPSSASTSGSSSTTTKPTKRVLPPKPTSEKVACDLKAIYPDPKTEYSFEELMMMKRFGSRETSCDWVDWEWNEAWKIEVKDRNLHHFDRDVNTGYPLLFDRATGAPLYDFLPRSKPEALESPLALPCDPPTQDEPVHLIAPLSPSPASAQAKSSTPSRSLSSSPAYVDRRRQPSPTINTREAQAMIDGLFAKTLNFGDMKPNTYASSSSASDSEPDTEDEDDNGRAAWADIPISQLDVAMSQMTSQGGLQSQTSEIDTPFVPFSQSASQYQDSLFGPSQFSQLPQSQDENDDDTVYKNGSSRTMMDLAGSPSRDEKEGSVTAKPKPMQLFRDTAVTSSKVNLPAFKPVVTRAPFGEKPIATSSAFAIHRDEPQGVFSALESRIPSSQPGENVDQSFEEFEAPIAPEEDSENDDGSQRAGVHLGRRPAGVPNRYEPFIHAMTPITERTGEYTAMSSLSSSMKSRRDSAFPATVEEDEDESDSEEEASTEDDDEEIGNQALFVSGAIAEEDDDGDTSSSSSRSSSSEEEEEEAAQPAPGLVSPLRTEAILDEVSHDWRDSTHKDGHFDIDVSVDRSGASGRQSTERSYDASLNTSLPEGFTITGNQTGMTTGMIVAEAPRLSLPSSLAAIDPWSNASIVSALARADPPVLSRSNVRDRTSVTINNLPQLQRAAKKREGKNRAKDRTGVFDEVWEFSLDRQTFPVRAKLGEGAFGAVFRVAMPSVEDEDPEASFDYDAEETTMAVKIEKPTNLWEFHILETLHSRLDERTRRSILVANRLDAYADESYLFVDVCTQGSLLDAINNANDLGISPPTGGASQGVDEILAMFFVIELLRVLEAFHRSGFIHGDLKIDNCLVRLEDVPNPARNWSMKYDRTGAGCWDAKGLKIIDFGRTLDLTTFAPDQKFICSFDTDQVDCYEMRQGQAWTFEPDYHGAASIAHLLLFGKPIETQLNESDGMTKQQITQLFRRYHQADLWSQLFDSLLNPRQVREGGVLPIVDELTRIRSLMEDWLELNSEKNGKSLKKMIKDM